MYVHTRTVCACSRGLMANIFTKDIAVLDVSSRLISAIVGVKKAQSVFGIKAVVEKEHSGYEQGEWFDADDTRSVAMAVLKEAMRSAESHTKRIFIGVPAEFTAVVKKDVAITLDRERRIVDADIDFLLKKGDTFDGSKFALINSSPISFSINTSDRLYRDVRGLVASKVVGTVSYILCEKSFTRFFDEIVASLGFKDVKYISTAWAEGITIFEKEERDDPYVLVDIGYISSSVIVGRGEGVEFMRSFSLGGGHISADMCEAMNVDFELAEQARELVDLNLNYQEGSVLVADADQIICGADASEVVREKLDLFAEIIYDIIEQSKVKLPPYAPVYLTGEGVASIRGVKKYLSSTLGMNVDIVMPKLPGYAKPCNSSKISLLVVAETLSNSKIGGLFKRVINGGNL